jgi:hypothetical protein
LQAQATEPGLQQFIKVHTTQKDEKFDMKKYGLKKKTCKVF